LQIDLSQGVIMAGLASFSFKDYSREISTVRFALPTIDAASFDAVNIGITNLQTAMLALQVENALQSRRVISDNHYYTRAPATSKAAQRENKWLVVAEDDTLHTLFRHEIPLAKLDLLGGNSDFLDLGAGAGAAFKTAFEGIVDSPAGNSSVLISVQYVGKRI
jgi:hypothetical protein